MPLTRDFDHFGVFYESTTPSTRGVTDQIAPVLQRTIAFHHRAGKLMMTHNDLEQEPELKQTDYLTI